MTPEFDRDREAALADAQAARAELLSRVGGLSDANLAVGRRGSWTVSGVLRHVIDADWGHGRGIASLREVEPPARAIAEQDEGPGTVEQALALLTVSGQRLFGIVAGVDEEAFYRLRKLGGQEWSVLSFLEGSADHDREHAAQIEALLGR
ncbi:MAG: DinB superfamily protein [Chloroflexi bacterium]|nr:MAG: DinB superfamily protein [Chloroflexota bacterium]